MTDTKQIEDLLAKAAIHVVDYSTQRAKREAFDAIRQALLDSRAREDTLREEIADYLGHGTDNIAGKYWAARGQFSMFESSLDDLLGDDKFEHLTTDDYDASLELKEATNDLRLGLEAQQFIKDAGFSQVYVNHLDGWETHYTLNDLPSRGWRRRYVSDPTVSTTNVIAGPENNGYWEIGYWPEGWDDDRSKAGLASGYYRIVPDPLAAHPPPDKPNHETEVM